MVILGRKVLLRDFIEEDIDDRIRWETIETEWQQWDAPWEEDEPFNPEAYRALQKKRLANQPDPNAFRSGFQVCLNDDSKKHIGWINAYRIDETYEYTKHNGYTTIGINIPDMASRQKGYATEAWILYIQYLLDKGIEEIYTQTWSGNVRVIGLMNKLGFVVCDRDKDFCLVRGASYDGLTFRLEVSSFLKFVAIYGNA